MNEEKELPEGWIWTKIGEIAETTSGGTPSRKSPQYFQGDIPWIKSGELNDTIILGAEEFISEEGLQNSSAKIFPCGTLLIAMYGATIGKTGILGIDAATNQAICAILPFNNIFIPKFGLYWLQSQRQNLIKQGFGGAQPNINQGVIYNLSFPLSPLPEQHRIVSVIEERFTILDAVTTALQQNKQKLKLARASVLKHAVEGKLTEKWRAGHPATESGSELLERILAERRAKWEAEQLAKGKDPRKLRYEEPEEPDVSGLLELPEGWCWARAEQFCDFITKGTTPAADKLHNESGDIPFIKVYNLTHNGYLDFSVKPTFVEKYTHMHDLARSKVFPGDILMNIVGPPLGKVSIVPSTYSEWNVNQAIAIFRPMPSYNRKLLVISILTEHILIWATKRAKTTAGQHNLTLEICRDLPFPMPPLAEQQQIVAEVERRLSVIEQAEAAIETSLKRIERARQSILERAFSGRLVPQDPNDEPASVLLERIQEERTRRVVEGKQRGRNGGVKAARGKKTKEQEFVPQWQLLRDAKESGSIDESLGHVGAHEDGALGRGEVGQREMDKEELGDLVQMPLLSLWD